MAAFVDFKVVKETVSAEKAVQLLGLVMRKHGDQLRSACPACKSGGDRALTVNLNKNAYYCFAEGKGGDVIALAAHVRGDTPRDRRRNESDPDRDGSLHPLAKTRSEAHPFRLTDTGGKFNRNVRDARVEKESVALLTAENAKNRMFVGAGFKPAPTL